MKKKLAGHSNLAGQCPLLSPLATGLLYITLPIGYYFEYAEAHGYPETYQHFTVKSLYRPDSLESLGLLAN